MVSYLASLGAYVGYKAATATVDYVGATTKGHVAMGTLNNIKNGIENAGTDVAGPVVGKAVGNFLGRAVAGHNIPLAMQNGDKASDAIKAIGDQTIQLASHHIDQGKREEAIKKANIVDLSTAEQVVQKEPVKSFDYTSAALKTAKAAGTLGATVAIATGAVPFVSASLAYAAVKAYPAIQESLFTAVDKNDPVNMIDDVVTPIATQMAIQSAGYVVQGVVQYDAIKKAYQAAPVKGEQMAKGLTSWMPKSVQKVAGNIGYYLGKADAGRQIMKQEVLDDVTNQGQIAKNATEIGLGAINLVVRANTTPNNEGSIWKTAKNVGIVSAGILGSAALVAVAPEVAIVTGGTALLTIAPRAITWVKKQMLPQEAEAKVAATVVQETQATRAVKFDIGHGFVNMNDDQFNNDNDAVLVAPAA